MTSRFSPAAALMVVGSCLSLQFGAAIAIQLFPHAGTWGVTLLRLTLAGLLLLLITRPRLRGWDRRSWLAVALFGASLAGMNGMFYAGLAHLPLGTAVAIEFLGPLVLAAVLSRKAADLVWVALAFAGMAVLGVSSLNGTEPLDPLGVLFVLVAGAFWALYILAGNHVARTVPGNGGLSVAVLVGAVLVAPIGAWTVGPVLADPGLLLVALLAAVLASVIPYSLEFAALRRMPRNVFGVLLSIEPAAAAFAGFVLLGQTVTLTQWVTIALVMTASVGITLSAARHERARAGDRRAVDVRVLTAPVPVPRRRGLRPRGRRAAAQSTVDRQATSVDNPGWSNVV